MVSLFETALLLVIAILSIAVVALIKSANLTQQGPQNSQRIQESQKHTKEQDDNVQILETASHQLAEQLKHIYRPDGPVLKADENLKALVKCQAQLQSMESVLHDTQSKLIVLEHGKAVAASQQPTELAKATTSDASANNPTQQDSRIQELQNQLASSESKFEALFTEFQKQVFSAVTSPLWIPTDDDQIKRDFKKLARAIYNWTKKNLPVASGVQNASLSSTLSSIDYQTLLESLKTVVHFKTEDLPQYLQSEQKKGPMLLLSALLAHDICVKVFQNPFSCLGPGGGAFYDIYQAFLSHKELEKDTHIWRSDVLRSLRPRTPRNPVFQAAADAEFKKRVQKLSSDRAHEFLNSPARFLISKNMTENWTRKLVDMYMTAAELSYHLWTHPILIRFATLHDLDPQDRLFDTANPRLKPTPVVEGRGESHLDGLKGSPIEVVVHPLVEVSGNYDPERRLNAGIFDEKKVWVGAEVWLEGAIPP